MPHLRRPFKAAPRKCLSALESHIRGSRIAIISGFPFLSAIPVFLICILPFSRIQAQEFAASLIPAELKTDADAIVRSSEYDIEIKSPSHALIRERKVITILNEHADDLAEYRTFYSKMTGINSVEGTLYSGEGKELRKFKKKDMTDRPVWDGETMASDYRYKYAGFSSHQYPYTVVFEEEDELNGIVSLHDWLPQTERNTSVQFSRCTITAPKGYAVRYKMLRSDVKPAISEIKDKEVYTWEIRDIKPVPDEPFGLPWTAQQPLLLIAPSAFEAAGYKGDMSTWNDYAKFYAELARGRDVLPDDIKTKVHALADAETDPRKKIAVLYDFLQKNTHYVSVQLGIGGWQPFDAAYVSHNKYGDCKALSNYMKSLLKEAGIASNVVIIRGGKNATEFQPDFPDNQFNHVICCVPLAKDTVWLECTDQFLPAGYLSGFTANRYGLLITDDGGRLIHTPDYALKENSQVRSILAVLDQEGNLKLRCNGVYRAERQDNLESMLHHLSRSEQEGRLKQQFDLPTYDVAAFDYQTGEDKGLPMMKETLDITANSYAQVSGKRIFIDPDLLTRSEVRFAPGEKRSRDLYFRDAYSLEDSVQISIPEGYAPESLPKNQSLKTAFGEFRTITTVGPGKITYHRYFEQLRGGHPVAAYAEACAFYNAIYKSDRDKIVLTKAN